MKKILTSIIMAAAVLSGCKETPIELPEEKGSFSISVDEITDQYITKSDVTLNPKTFDVVIDGEHFDYSGKFGEMPDVFENVPAGNYTVSVSSPDKALAAFDQPIFSGSQEFTVKAREITSVQVICTIQNVKVSIEPTEEFFNELESYTVSISNGEGAENTLIWTNGELQDANYAELTAENVGVAKSGFFTEASALNIYVTGYRRYVPGEEAVYAGIISPISAKDHFIIKLHACETGQLGDGLSTPGIVLKVDYTTNDKDEYINVPGFDMPSVDGPDDGGDNGDNGDGGDNGDQGGEEELTGLSLEWPANPGYGVYELKSEYSPEEVTLTVKAENYISGFVVKIASPTAAFLVTVKEIAGCTTEGEYAVLDLLNPETAAAMTFLPTGDSLLNRAEIEFPLSDLLPMITFFAPEVGSVHTFVMEVTDTKGQVLTKELQFEYKGN